MRRGALLSAGGRIVVALAGASTTVAVGRILGPAGFGVYSVALTLVAVLQVLTTLGVETGIVYYVSSGLWAIRDAFHRSQRLAFVCGAACIGAALVARTIVPHAFHGLTLLLTLITAAALPFLLSWLFAAYIALAAGAYSAFIRPSVIKEISGLIAITALALWQGVAGAILGLAVANVVAAAGGAPLVRRVVRKSSEAMTEGGQSGSEMLTRAVWFGLKGSAGNALQTINLRLDTFVLNAVVSTTVVGHYGLAISVTSVMTIIPGALSDALFPQAAALHKAAGDALDDSALRFAELKSLRHCVIATAASAMACVVGLLVLVVPVYGVGFRPTILLGLLLLPGTAGLGIASVLATAVVARGRSDVPLRIALAVTPATVGLYLVLVPAFHAVGAAAASSASYLATFTAMCWWYQRVTGRRALRAMSPTLADAADYWHLLSRALDRARSQAG